MINGVNTAKTKLHVKRKLAYSKEFIKALMHNFSNILQIMESREIGLKIDLLVARLSLESLAIKEIIYMDRIYL